MHEQIDDQIGRQHRWIRLRTAQRRRPYCSLSILTAAARLTLCDLPLQMGDSVAEMDLRDVHTQRLAIEVEALVAGEFEKSGLYSLSDLRCF